jgi:hypothetical protein
VSCDSEKPVNEAETWGTWCRLTCLGGSEHGECPCDSPRECQMQDDPKFEDKRAEAKARMCRIVLTNIGG